MFACMISRPGSKLGHLGQKLARPLGQIKGKITRSKQRKTLLTLWGHIFEVIIMNLAEMFVLMISRPSPQLGHLGSKPRSTGQIKGKPC